MPQTIPTLDLEMPDDFPATAYSTIAQKMLAALEASPGLNREWGGAWTAVAYRYRACHEHGLAYVESALAHGHGPPQPQRYAQERELFDFFVNGLSAIEATYYAFNATASLLDPAAFPFGSLADRTNVTPERTTKQFETRFAADPFTAVLRGVLNDTQFRRWVGVRNVLAHRVVLPRTFRIGGASPVGASTYANVQLKDGAVDIDIDTVTTTSLLGWLAATVTKLLTEADSFVSRHQAEFEARQSGGDRPG